MSVERTKYLSLFCPIPIYSYPPVRWLVSTVDVEELQWYVPKAVIWNVFPLGMSSICKMMSDVFQIAISNWKTSKDSEPLCETQFRTKAQMGSRDSNELFTQKFDYVVPIYRRGLGRRLAKINWPFPLIHSLESRDGLRLKQRDWNLNGTKRLAYLRHSCQSVGSGVCEKSVGSQRLGGMRMTLSQIQIQSWFGKIYNFKPSGCYIFVSCSFSFCLLSPVGFTVPITNMQVEN